MIAGTSVGHVHIGTSAFLGVSVSDPDRPAGRQARRGHRDGAQIVGTLPNGRQAAGLGRAT